ncbi:hypothetical protein EMCRGX_G016133 [Ephydatia muelleri]
MDGVDVCVNGEDLPLVIRATQGNDSAPFLKAWVKKNKKWIDEKLLQNGAILFRGFHVTEGAEFEDILKQYEPELSDEYRGVSPRKLVPGTKYVFSASELPPYFPIPQHLEMSFLPSPPRKIFFCCLDPPTSPGGETCLCDFKKVHDQMDPKIRKEFEDKGVMHLRNYKGTKTGLLTDPTMLKGWQDVFGTTSRQVVEEELRKSGAEFQWRDGDSLRIVDRGSAIEKHPVTGEKIWFNHSQVFHWSMIPSEYYRIYKRLGQMKYLLFSWMMWLLKVILFTFLGPMRVGFHTCFGDGSEIPESYLEHIRDVMWKNMVFNRWELGDIVLIDNYWISHGRQPYSGNRKVVVSWSKPYLKPSHRDTT